MKKYLDKKLFFILLGYVAAYKTVNILQAMFLKLKGIEGWEKISWSQITWGQLMGTFITIPPIVIIILVITKMMIDQKYSWKYIIGFHFLFSWIYGFLVNFTGELYLLYFEEGHQLELFNKKGILNLINTSGRDFLGYVGFVSIIYSYYYIDKSTKMEIQKTKLSQQLLERRMEALKSQLNPHFLFNTLNSVSALTIENPKKAQDMIVNLGDLLREVLLLKDTNLVPVYKEIIVLNKYIDIMMIRFSDHLNIEVKIDEECKNKLIPVMLIQPIIENSLKHGYSYDITELIVELRINLEDNKLVIEIENNGKSMDYKELHQGVGIINIKERLSTLYPDEFEFNIHTSDNKKGVITIIKIPIQEYPKTEKNDIEVELLG